VRGMCTCLDWCIQKDVRVFEQQCVFHSTDTETHKHAQARAPSSSLSKIPHVFSYIKRA
jgi:hypothetical protein